jgi:hypothetical protein
LRRGCARPTCTESAKTKPVVTHCHDGLYDVEDIGFEPTTF